MSNKKVNLRVRTIRTHQSVKVEPSDLSSWINNGKTTGKRGDNVGV